MAPLTHGGASLSSFTFFSPEVHLLLQAGSLGVAQDTQTCRHVSVALGAVDLVHLILLEFILVQEPKGH